MMNDLKKYMKLDEKKIEKSLDCERGLQRLNDQKKDVKYWLNYFQYDEKLSALENFCRYKSAGAFDLYEDTADDADITEPVLVYFRKKLLDMNEVNKVFIGKEIDSNEKNRALLIEMTNGRNVYLETDTAVSLQNDFGIYMRKIIPIIEELNKKVSWPDETYIKYYNLPTNWCSKDYAPFKFYYFGELQKEILNVLETKKAEEEEEIECYKALEKRAQYTHTIKNMMLVPYGYNAPRGFQLSTYSSKIKLKDRLDLTIKDYEEMLNDENMTDEIFQKRLFLKRNKQQTTLDAVRFLMDHKSELMPRIPHIEGEAEKNTIDGILKRTRIINSIYE